MTDPSIGTRILLVDDSIVMRHILEKALRLALPHLIYVLNASNGEQGLTALQQSAAANQPIHLILCDMHMPQLDGLDFLLRMKQLNLASNVPFLMITADTGDPRVSKSIDAAAVGFLSKPFTLQQVQERVLSLLNAVTNNKARNLDSSGPIVRESSAVT